MKKKILMFIFFTLITFVINVKVYALQCNYTLNDDEGNEVRFEITFDKGVATNIKTSNGIRAIFLEQKFETCPKELYVSESDSSTSGYFIVTEHLGTKMDFVSSKVNCGNITDIPVIVPELTSFFVSVIQVFIPVVLVILGSIDFIKGMMAQKEDEIKKGQQVFIKRLITAVIIFLVVVLVKFIMSIVADATDSDNIASCISCFINEECN